MAEVAARTMATCLRSLPTAKAQLLCSAGGADIVRSLLTEEVSGCASQSTVAHTPLPGCYEV